VHNFAKSHIKRKTGKSGEIMWFYLRTRDARSDSYCYCNAKLHFRNKDDTVVNNCNNINVSVRHYPSCNVTRLDFRQKLNRS